MMLDDSMEVMTSSQKQPRNLHSISSHKVKGGGEFCNATNPDDLGFDSLDTPANLTDITDVLMVKHWEMAYKHHADKVATQETATGQGFVIIFWSVSPTVIDQMEVSTDGGNQSRHRPHCPPLIHMHHPIHWVHVQETDPLSPQSPSPF